MAFMATRTMPILPMYHFIVEFMDTWISVLNSARLAFISDWKVKLYTLPKYFTSDDGNLSSLKAYVEDDGKSSDWSCDHNGSWSTYRYSDIDVFSLVKWFGEGD